MGQNDPQGNTQPGRGSCGLRTNRQTPHPRASRRRGLHASTYGSNDLGCSGWYTGTAHPDMTCRASADSAAGYPIVLRNGTWNGTSGFGWSKAYYYHNLWTKPIVDTIAYGLISGTPSNKDYEVIHYTDGEIDQYVIVVADTTATSWGGISTQDGREVGVLTGYCQNAAGATEPECPGWVDDTL